jgi:hypothetical protein
VNSPFKSSKSATRRLAVVALIVLAQGCTTVNVVPEASNTEIPSGKIATVTSILGASDVTCPVESTTAEEFLPTIRVGPSVANCFAKYTVAIRYRGDEVPPILSLFNPLVLVGFPTGSSEVIIDAQLIISVGRESKLSKIYSASAHAETTEGLYSVANNSELRRAALLAARDEIQNKINADPPVLIRPN